MRQQHGEYGMNARHKGRLKGRLLTAAVIAGFGLFGALIAMSVMGNQASPLLAAAAISLWLIIAASYAAQLVGILWRRYRRGRAD